MKTKIAFWTFFLLMELPLLYGFSFVADELAKSKCPSDAEAGIGIGMIVISIGCGSLAQTIVEKWFWYKANITKK